LLSTLLIILSINSCQFQDQASIIPEENKTNETKGNTKKSPLKLGILSIDSAVSVNERYAPLADYLETVTGYDFELVSLTQETQFSQVAMQLIDFTSTNPLSAVQVQRLYDTKFLVTHSRPQTKTMFSGLIIVDADSDFKTLEDLRGKNGACVNFQTAAAGCTFQIYHLLQQGIDPEKDFASFLENKSQDNITLGVLNGTLDFGFIRTGQLEKMVKKGLIASTEELRILEPMDDDFFYEHTTALYPEWPIAALPHVEPEIVQKVETALLSIPEDHPALKAVGVEKFVPAVDYSKLEDLIEALKLKTWDVP
jgi:ABC-type phosphate/phosphonate transport system substrate-binding protein